MWTYSCVCTRFALTLKHLKAWNCENPIYWKAIRFSQRVRINISCYTFGEPWLLTWCFSTLGRFLLLCQFAFVDAAIQPSPSILDYVHLLKRIDRYWHAVTLLQARPILKLFFRALVLVLIALHSATLATPATLATLPHLQHPWSSIEERHAEDHLSEKIDWHAARSTSTSNLPSTQWFETSRNTKGWPRIATVEAVSFPCSSLFICFCKKTTFCVHAGRHTWDKTAPHAKLWATMLETKREGNEYSNSFHKMLQDAFYKIAQCQTSGHYAGRGKMAGTQPQGDKLHAEQHTSSEVQARQAPLLLWEDMRSKSKSLYCLQLGKESESCAWLLLWLSRRAMADVL